jgi:hypothetical protein
MSDHRSGDTAENRPLHHRRTEKFGVGGNRRDRNEQKHQHWFFHTPQQTPEPAKVFIHRK